jgi:hypothetical protein
MVLERDLESNNIKLAMMVVTMWTGSTIVAFRNQEEAMQRFFTHIHCSDVKYMMLYVQGVF